MKDAYIFGANTDKEKLDYVIKEFEMFKKNTAFREGLSIENRERLKKELEDKDELIKELWGLWESMAECGELTIGPKFSEQYERVKKQII